MHRSLPVIAVFVTMLAALAGCGSKPEFEREHPFVFDIGTDENRPVIRLGAQYKTTMEYSGRHLLTAHLPQGDYLAFGRDYGGGTYYRASDRVRLEYTNKTTGKFDSDVVVDGGIFVNSSGESSLYWFWGSDFKQPFRVATPSLTYQKATLLDEGLRRARLEREEDARKIAAEERRRASIRDELTVAQTRNKVSCNGAQCDRAFALAQAYLLQQSDMRIQVATSTLIETFNATSPGNLSMRIVRVPTTGDAWDITLTVGCKDEPTIADLCATKLLRAYSGFLPHMNSR